MASVNARGDRAAGEEAEAGKTGAVNCAQKPEASPTEGIDAVIKGQVPVRGGWRAGEPGKHRGGRTKDLEVALVLQSKQQEQSGV